MALTLRYPRRVYPRMPKRLPLMEQYPLYALEFDGIDDYVLVADSPSLRITKKITIEAWVNVINTGAFEEILTGKSYTYFLAIFGGSIRWYLGNGAAWFITSVTPIAYGVTTHVAATYDSSTGRWEVYKNGALANSGSVTPQDIGLNDQGVCIGAYPPSPSTYWFKGVIVEPRVYNRALSQSEIQRNMYNPLNPIRDGLVLWLPLLEGSGTTVKDYSGNNNNGALYNGVAWRELALYEIPAGAGL